LHIPLLSGYSTQKAETGTAYLLILASQTPPGNPVSKYSLRKARGLLEDAANTHARTGAIPF